MDGSPQRRRQRRQNSREGRREQIEAETRRQRRQRLLWWGGGTLLVLIVVIFLLMTGRSSGVSTIDGIDCNPNESFVTHIHQHLVLYNKGVQIPVPAGIGINTAQGCLFWLHTHAANGVIHVESPTHDTYTLGQFFHIWGQPLSRTQIGSAQTDGSHALRVYVGNQLYKDDPTTIKLTSHERITLEVGPPWVAPPPYTFAASE